MGFGFCFLFSLISKKDEGILGIVFVFEKKKKKKENAVVNESLRVYFTRLESQDSYNLQFVIQRSSCLSCIGDINSTKREEKIEEREREREREKEKWKCVGEVVVL